MTNFILNRELCEKLAKLVPDFETEKVWSHPPMLPVMPVDRCDTWQGHDTRPSAFSVQEVLSKPFLKELGIVLKWGGKETKLMAIDLYRMWYQQSLEALEDRFNSFIKYARK